MRRYPIVLGVTAAGLAGVLSFHTRSTASLPPSTPQAVGGGTTTTTSGAGAPPTTAGSTPTTAPAAGGTTTPATATGTAEQYGFGVLSVRVTTRGSKITDVTVATLQVAETYSQQLANQVIPILRREVLATQSARISSISGATYTSEAYAASVQSALDKLRK